MTEKQDSLHRTSTLSVVLTSLDNINENEIMTTKNDILRQKQGLVCKENGPCFFTI